jgi:hypothetical protein
MSNGLTAQENNQLATYNSEVTRGIVHHEWWQRRMAGFQERFDNAQIEHNKKYQKVSSETKFL